ncbi:MAG TPA: class I SAM-dependent methyltransferase, partial [Nitrososphaeraceae archaeon]|nr:class I SAM-dependent methyltransferase [Nitrososphaeraceae archaeon]
MTRENNIYNFATSMQWIPILSQVEDEIIECFVNGGGVSYSSFKRFHEVMAEESYQTVVIGYIDYLLSLVLNLIINLKNGIKVLDIGCGKGKAVNLMAKHFPTSSFYGYDLSNKAIDDAIKDSKDMNNANTFFKNQDILDLTLNEKFDLITAFDAIHDQPKPDLVLKNIYKSLSEKRIFLMQDILDSASLKHNISHILGP